MSRIKGNWTDADWSTWYQSLAKAAEDKNIISISESCPDCGDDPESSGLHKSDCRRIIDHGNKREYLQFGPPWFEWEE